MGDKQLENSNSRPEPLSPGAGRQSKVVTLLFTDVEGSTALKQRLGDHAGVDLLKEHHELVRQSIRRFEGAEEVNLAGDSFLIAFPVPSDAVKCAVLLQACLAEFNEERPFPILDRMGLHMGEVRVDQGSSGTREVHGIQVDTCARVMSLAQGGQILMTRPVFDNARQSFKREEKEGPGGLTWLDHGQFQLKGVEGPIEICEVRRADAGTLSLPSTSEKAHRVETGEGETVRGWRPAVGQLVPSTQWVLEEKLGEGGFGEVWKARHEDLECVFKFCFRADRVRSLKREVVLFRILKERIGEHPNIVRLHDIYFDQPPFYLQEEYVSGRDLRRWCEDQGGVEAVPLETRLEIVAQAADALQAAHDAGVIHRDVKPGNILLSSGGAGTRKGSAETNGGQNQSASPVPLAKLTDFGIGQVISDEVLKDVTRTGLTGSLLGDEDSSREGTQLYIAPEVFEGKPASTRSDIYSLGVVLYQLVVGDFNRSLTTDWAEEIPDPLLREDLHHCFAGRPEERFAAAGLLATNLRALPARRTELEQKREERAALERAAYRRGMLRTAAIAGVIVAVIVLLAWQARLNGLAKIRQAAQIRSTAVRLTVANGLNPAESGDWLSAALWFSEAFVMDESFGTDPQLTRGSHVLRIDSVLRQSPRLQNMWFDMEGSIGVPALDDRQVLLGGAPGYRLYSIASGKATSPLVGPDQTWASRSPDGTRAVTGGGSTNATFSVWEVYSGKRLFYLLDPAGENPFRGECSDLEISRDGRWIAAAVSGTNGSLADRVMIWEAATGRVRRVLHYEGTLKAGWSEGEDFLLSARFDVSGERLVTAGSDKRAVVWKWQTEQPPQVLKGHGSWVYSGCFGRVHTNWLLTCSFDRTAWLWDLQTGQRIFSVQHEGDAINDVEFSPDDRMFVTAGLDFAVRLWDTETRRMIPPVLRSHDRVLQAQWSADGRSILARNRDGTVRLWQLKGEKPMVEAGSSPFSDDGRLALTQEGSRTPLRSRAGCLEVGAAGLLDTNLLSIRFAGDAALLAFTGLGSGAPAQVGFRRLEGSTEKAFTYDPSAQWVSAPGGGRFIMFGGTNHSLTDGSGAPLLVWEPEKAQEVRRVTFTNETVEAVAFDHQGRWMAVGSVKSNSSTGNLRLIAAEPTERSAVFLPCDQRIRHLEFSRDDQWLVAALWDDGLNPGRAHVWHAAKPGAPFEEQARLEHLDGVLYAAFSDSGHAIATASEDQTAIVWQRTAGKWEPSLRPLRCGGQVYLCAFSRDGKWLATAHRTAESHQLGYWNTHIRIWDIANNEARSLPFAVPGRLTRLAFVAGDARLFAERWSLSEPAQRWIIDLAGEERSARELLLRAQLLSSQRSFLSGRAEHLAQALESKLSAEKALVHATSIGPLRPLSKKDCEELWKHFAGGE